MSRASLGVVALVVAGVVGGAGALAASMRPFADMTDRAMRPISAQGGEGVPAPTVTITSPASSPVAASTTPSTVSGTTTGTATSCAWSTAPAAGAGSCTYFAPSFFCEVTQQQDAAPTQTVTVACTGPGGVGNDTTDLVFPAFQLQPGSTTPNDLPDALTVAAAPMTLVLACDAQGLTPATSWACRDVNGAVALPIQEGGATPTLTTSTPFHALDSTERMVQTVGGDYYATTAGNVLVTNGDDVVIEIVIARQGSSNRAWAGNATTSTVSTGVAGLVLSELSGNYTLRINDGGATPVSATRTGSPVGAFDHLVGWVDDDASIGLCANGSCSAAASIAALGSWAPTGDQWALLAADGGSGAGVGGGMVSFRMWKCSGCLGASVATDVAAVSRERTATSFGVAPLLAAGDDAPTAMTRASPAFVATDDVGVTSLFYFGNNAPRVAARGSTRGFVSEPQVTNILLQSQTFGTTWTQTSATVGADVEVAPDGTTTADSLVGLAATTQHRFNQTVSVTAATYTFAVYAKAGAGAGNDSITLLSDATVDNGACFNLSTCAAIGAYSGSTPIAIVGESLNNNGWCRFWMTYTGAAESQSMQIYANDTASCTTFADLSYTGDGVTPDVYLWGAELEAFPTKTSYTPTTTVSVTRSADDVRFDAAGHYAGSPTTLHVGSLCPSFDVATTSTLTSVGTSNVNYLGARIDATADRPNASVITSGGNSANVTSASGDVTDGSAHSIRIAGATNDVEMYFDGVSFGTDTLVDFPAGSASIFLGTRAGTAEQPACLITNLRLWPRDVTPTEAP